METSKNSKPFWNKCKPYFSNKHAHGESKIILIEKENVTLTSNEVVESEKLIVKNDEIAKIFNKHFSETVDKLNIFEWPSCESEYTEDQLTNIINKYKSHPSIKKIKSNYTIKQKFSFKPVTVKDPMDTSSSTRYRFDVQIPRGMFVEITSILKGESTWKL